MTHHKHIKAGLVVALAGGAVMASGCGESTPEAAKDGRAAGQGGLRAVPDARRRAARLPSHRERFARSPPRRSRSTLPSRRQSGAEVRSAGMGLATFQPTEGPNTVGVTSVTLFASAKGAARWLALEQRDGLHPEARPRRWEGPPLRRARHPGRARLDGFQGRSPRRQRLLGPGALPDGPRQRGPRPVRRPSVDRREGDLPAHEGTVPVTEGSNPSPSANRAGFLAVAGLLALAALVSAFAPGAPAPHAERRSESSPAR